MFNKLKQLKQMQDVLSKEQAEEEVNGVKVVINGKMEILNITLNPDLNKEEQEESIKMSFNKALHKIEFSLASKMSQFKGL